MRRLASLAWCGLHIRNHDRFGPVPREREGDRRVHSRWPRRSPRPRGSLVALSSAYSFQFSIMPSPDLDDAIECHEERADNISRRFPTW